VLFAHVGDGAAGGGPGRQVLRVAGGAEDDRDTGIARDDLPGRLDAVHLGHVDVHEHQGRPESGDELHRLGAALRLPRELEAVEPAQHGPGGQAERRLIVDHQHGPGIAHAPPSLTLVRPVRDGAVLTGSLARSLTIQAWHRQGTADEGGDIRRGV
jgi:hypothetical protein